MNLSIIRSNTTTETTYLIEMQLAVLPHELPFPPSVWREQPIEAYWIIVNNTKVGLIATESNFEPGENYEADSWPAPGSLYLILIGLVPEWQGKGLGRVGMEWLKAHALSRGFSRVVSNLRTDNTPSMKLHLRSGFSGVDVRKDYYSNPTEDSPVLEIWL